MRKYVRVLYNQFQTGTQYRSRVVTSVIEHLLFPVSAVILWAAIYRSTKSVNGIGYSEMIFYYMLIPLAGYITKTSQVNIRASEIKTGKISSKLIKPYWVVIEHYLETIGFKATYLSIVIPLYVLIVLVIISTIGTQGLHVTILNCLLGLLFALLITPLSFIMEMSIAYLAFWIDETWSFEHMKEICHWLFGGLSFPFELLSPQMRTIFELLPFKYFYYVPVSYALGRREVSQYLLLDLLELLIWSITFTIIAMVLWKKGLRRYGAYGN